MNPKVALAVYAHPDDESIVSGGLMRALSINGWAVHVVSLTKGEFGPDYRSDPSRDLAQTREAELRCAADVLGLSSVTCLDFADGSLGHSGPTLEKRVGAILDSARPQIMLTFGSDGLYGHPDHIAAHHAAIAAWRRAPNERRPWLYFMSTPQHLFVRLVAKTRRRGLPSSLWGLQPMAFGVERSTLTHEIDVRHLVSVKLMALRCYRSQIGPDNVLTDLPIDLALEFFGTEWATLGGRGPSDEDPLETVAVARTHTPVTEPVRVT